jgi:DNA-binding transcriptional LysR family regulator
MPSPIDKPLNATPSGDAPPGGRARAALRPWQALDPKAVLCFLAVARERHFGRAARALGMSQPPLSIRIRQLEDCLSVRLFERGRAGVWPTPAGEALAAELDMLVPRIAESLARVQAADRGELGELRIGFVTPAEYSFLPDRLRDFRAKVPGVRLSLREMTSDAQVQALIDGSLDAGFVLPPIMRPELSYRAVHADRLVLALPATHRLARGQGALALTAVAADPLVIFPRDKAPGLFDLVQGMYAGAGIAPRVGQEAIQMQTILSLVAAGLGVAVVPASMTNLGRRGVAYRPIRGRTPTVEIGLAWRAGRRAPALARFLEAVPALAATGRRGSPGPRAHVSE